MPEKRRLREKESLNVPCASQQQWCIKNPNTLLPHPPPKKNPTQIHLSHGYFGFYMERERIDPGGVFLTCGAGWVLKGSELCHRQLGDALRRGVPPRSRIATAKVIFQQNSHRWSPFTWGWFFREHIQFTNGCILAFIISSIFRCHCGLFLSVAETMGRSSGSQMAPVVSLLLLEAE